MHFPFLHTQHTFPLPAFFRFATFFFIGFLYHSQLRWIE